MMLGGDSSVRCLDAQKGSLALQRVTEIWQAYGTISTITAKGDVLVKFHQSFWWNMDWCNAKYVPTHFPPD